MPRRRPPQTDSRKPGFTSVYVPARGLLSLGPVSTIWDGPLPLLPKSKDVDGFIVRLIPPPEAADDRIEATRKYLVSLGAAKVFVHAKQKADVVPQKYMSKEQDLAQLGPRKVVEALVDNSNSEDVELLRKIVQDVMGKEGL